MEKNGHQFLLVARKKDVLHQLLSNLGFDYVDRGKGGTGFFSRLFYLIKTNTKLYFLARKFKPDLFLSFASTYAAHASFLYRKPHIVLDDTEHSTLELSLYSPFSAVILNPRSFWRKYSNKQLFFDSFIELTHLHPKYFKPDPDVKQAYDIMEGESFFIVRFISWDASHDTKATGLQFSEKFKIIEMLKKRGKVIISSECELPIELEQYRLKIRPEHLHSLIYYAHMYIGEGATTASESVILGTPAIYVNTLDAGTLSEQSEKYGLVSLRNSEGIFEKIKSLLEPKAKERAIKNREALIQDKIDLTAFLVWFVENYPSSKVQIAQYPNYQYSFK